MSLLKKPGFSLVGWGLPGLSWIKTRFLVSDEEKSV
jgi:hypothetical protein